MTLETISKHIANVKELQYGKQATQFATARNPQEAEEMKAAEEPVLSSMSAAKTIFDGVKAQVRAINSDPALTAIGQAEKEREVKRQGAINLAKMVRTFEVLRDKTLDEAEEAAKEIIGADDIKPDDFKIAEYDRKLTELKTQISVFGSKDAAREFQRMLNSESDPYFANKLVEEFNVIGGQVRDHVNVMDLQSAYTNAKRTAETDGRAQARQALSEIESLRQQSPVDSMLGMAVDQAIGAEYRTILSNPEGFLKAQE